MTHSVLIAGGGIAGLAAAFALTRAGLQTTACERAPAFTEVGAGVQLGPNVTRILHAWGLEAALHQVAFQPQQLVARNLSTGECLATLRLQDMQQRFGAPYMTVHRADLHGLLLAMARANGVELCTDAQVQALSNQPEGVVVSLGSAVKQNKTYSMAVVAAGVWSQLRQ